MTNKVHEIDFHCYEVLDNFDIEDGHIMTIYYEDRIEVIDLDSFVLPHYVSQETSAVPCSVCLTAK